MGTETPPFNILKKIMALEKKIMSNKHIRMLQSICSKSPKYAQGHGFFVKRTEMTRRT